MADDANTIHIFCDDQPRKIIDLTISLIDTAQQLGHALKLLDDENREALIAAKRLLEEVRGNLTLHINREAE